MLTPEAKRLLAETIRDLRVRLLRDIHDEADRRYRLSLPIKAAKLDEAHQRRRERIEASLDERARATGAKSRAELAALQARLFAEAEKEAAATLINRVVLLRLLEAQGLVRIPVVTSGWKSKGYREFRDFAPTLCINGTSDPTEGYATLLQLVFDELALDLPGLYGDVGLTRLFAIPAGTLRELVECLDNPALASAWTDDTTLGWVYQYWNDPDREALDAKINGGGKIEPHEIASKTQMFTERYMVEWLLQNSLGLTWLAMCKRHGWTADAERVLPLLDARRAEWRKRREAGQVALDALMPIDGELEAHWKYYVPQPIPDDAVAAAPASVRSLKILDPACGSGHFLVIAFDLLTVLYREEARHLGQAMSNREIAESILENNLYGIDIDSRAIQIAAAALYLKCRALDKEAHPRRLNLVAPVLQLGNLPSDDPAVVELRRDLRHEAGIPEELTTKLLAALAGVDYLGSLLKVDAAIGEAIATIELEFERSHGQGDMFKGFAQQQVKLSAETAKATILDRLEQFLGKHSKSGDLGLRLDGEQLAAGVRFIRIAKEGQYDVVVGNPPYQGLSKTASFGYVATKYPRGKDNLYAAFLERGLELARPSGLSALLTMRGWMFLGQFTELRKSLLKTADLRLLGDVDRGAFEDVPDEVLATVMSIFRRSPPNKQAVALQPTPTDDRSRDSERTQRKRAALLAQVGRYEFDPRGFEVVDGEPIVYWWTKDFLAKYAAAPKLGTTAPVRTGLCTSDNTRFLRKWWEIARSLVSSHPTTARWAWFVTGAKGLAWIEPCDDACQWHNFGLEVKTYNEHLYGSYSRTVQNEAYYFRRGIAYTPIGSTFRARAFRRQAIMGKMGSSVFAPNVPETLCSMNTSRASGVLQSLNPGLHFEVGDVNRLPVFEVECAREVYESVENSFSEREAARETSVEFRQPGPTTWNDVQNWAQVAIDRLPGTELPRYQPSSELAAAVSLVSFAIGLALGRFGNGREEAANSRARSALPKGIMFVAIEGDDSVDDLYCAPLLESWKGYGVSVGGSDDLRTYLRKSFFDYHKKLYENRPIYMPLSSAKKSFVAFVSIHRWADDTLDVLLAEHLIPARRRIEGEMEDLRAALASGTNKSKAARRHDDVLKLLEELNDFITKVTELADKGPPPPDDKTQKREVDARYAMDLDDGVMVNSAALWPLLEPQWKDPKKWWKQLANAQGKKDYDWSHLAGRYFPTRVRAKCHTDPSLAVAHKCFWELHPAKAYAWELRLQDEIRPDFTIDEPLSDASRARFLVEHGGEAQDIVAKEQKRRDKKNAKAEDQGESGPLFENDADAEPADAAEDERD